MQKRKYKALLYEKEYLKLWFADMVNRFGDALDMIVYSIIMYEVTQSESLMALIIGINFIPTVFIQPYAGAIVDRLEKKKVMVVCDVLRGLFVVCCIVLYKTHLLSPLLLAVLTFLTSTVESFRLPSAGAMLPLVLKKENYTLGKAFNYSSNQIALLVGLSLTPLFVSKIGNIHTLWIDVVTFVISACCIGSIRVIETIKQEVFSISSLHQDFKEGLSYIKQNEVIKMIAILGFIINFGLIPMSAFQVPYVCDVLHKNVEVLSYIKVIMIVGMMLGALFAPILKVKRSFIVSSSGVLMGIALTCIAIIPRISNDLYLMIALTLTLFILGCGGGMVNVMIGSSLMECVEPSYMARVMGINIALVCSSMPFGSFLCSYLVLKISMVQVFGLFGLCTVIFYGYMALTKKFIVFNYETK